MKNGTGDLERRLAARAKSGDKAAFTELLQRYNARVFGYFYRVFGRRELAQDLFQETFLRVWQSLHRFDPSRSFAAWVFTIAERISIDTMRSEGARATTVLPPDKIVQHDPGDVAADLEADELRRQIEKAVASLPEKQRKVFLLRQQGELSYKEIAGIMGEPLNTVLSHMHYAVKKIKHAIKVNNEI
jgi:RNA polymerase sigma-70 factor (ECF subfamily)